MVAFSRVKSRMEAIRDREFKQKLDAERRKSGR